MTKAWDLAPRITLRQDIVPRFPRTTLKAGLGVFAQPPQPIETTPFFGPIGLLSNKSVHCDLGFEQEVSHDVDLSVDAFYKSFEDQVVAGSGNSGTGFAYGVEWFLRYKPDAHFFGWLSYTMSRSERRDGPGQPLYLFPFDQTHVFTLLGSYKLGRGWQLGARFRAVSGNPYTPTSEGAYDASSGSQLGVLGFPPNTARLPPFLALDARVDKTWSFRSWKLNLYFDIQNVTNASNVEGINYNYNYTKAMPVNGLPILPISGVRAEF